ncbi:hypothetical protein Dsin_012502 [Dipteronia sinensis]|uniref:Uncharacterized protein n=1 Tax=Dipteronia sinensis TaxID=43782 RepID=A0AAE0AJH2_9ROSI|nr:hypothetical protein Dsin_012502 [Dipteronia sinensis]
MTTMKKTKTKGGAKIKNEQVLGVIAGHAYYFLEDAYPRMTGRHPLKHRPSSKHFSQMML